MICTSAEYDTIASFEAIKLIKIIETSFSSLKI